MINHDNKFIFIHINRTGGTSVEYYFTGETETNFKHFFPLDWKKSFPEEWESYFKFSTVRNPWDKVVSQWRFDTSRWGNKHPSFNNFTHFVKYTQGFPLRPQLHALTEPEYINYNDITTRVESNIDYIMRFENLHQDFDVLCKKIGIKNSGLPHKYDSYLSTEDSPEIAPEVENGGIRRQKPYQEFYNDETRDIVARIYDIDIKYFGYTFD